MVTSLYSDYVLPIAHHYERNDLMLQSRVPYLQVHEAVPLGEAVMIGKQTEGWLRQYQRRKEY